MNPNFVYKKGGGTSPAGQEQHSTARHGTMGDADKITKQARYARKKKKEFEDAKKKAAELEILVGRLKRELGEANQVIRVLRGWLARGNFTFPFTCQYQGGAKKG